MHGLTTLFAFLILTGVVGMAFANETEPADAPPQPAGYTIPIVDISGEMDRQVVNNWVRRGKVPRFWRESVLEMARSHRESALSNGRKGSGK